MGCGASAYYLAVFNRRQHHQVRVGRGLIVLGTRPPVAVDHLVVDDLQADHWQLELELVDQEHLRVANQGESDVEVGDIWLRQGEQCTVSLPAFWHLGETSGVIFRAVPTLLGVTSQTPRSRYTRRKRRRPDENNQPSTTTSQGGGVRDVRLNPQADASAITLSSFPSPSPETLTAWFSALARIQQLAASSPEFLQAAVDALVSPGGLDAGLLLLREDGDWKIAASSMRQVPWGIGFDPVFAECAWQRKETVYRASAAPELLSGQLADSALAAPIFDADQNVVAVLYGTRCRNGVNRRMAIRDLEARWVQVVAESVSSGVIRRKHEEDAARQRVLLEQAFPAEIVRQFADGQPLILPTEERFTTILFADLCDSSTISESLAPEATYQLLADVLDMMTRVVLGHHGVIVDYYGDGLIAMWNAPVEQANHAQLACAAGLQILDERRALNATWDKRLTRPLRLGIGIHSGPALVGNSGSRLRIKYGPRGLCVNLANRVERATRYLGYPLLISAATRRLLPADAAVRRLGQFRLWGFENAETLFALHALDSRVGERDWQERLVRYEETLRLIELGRFEEALRAMDDMRDETLDEESASLLRRQLQEALSLQGHRSHQEELVIDLTTLN